MAMELKPTLKLAQQLIMTPQLQQAIKLLQLSRLELIETLTQEMEINPLLEDGVPWETVEDEKETFEAPESVTFETNEPLEVSGVEPDRDDVNWETYMEEYSPRSVPSSYEPRETPSFENFLTKEEDLKDHLIWQLRLSRFSGVEEKIGAEIIGNINEDGYLVATVEEIAESTGCELAVVEGVLYRIQNFDPSGVAARNLKECLIAQIKIGDIQNPLVETIVRDHLDLLERKNYALLAKKLSTGQEEVREALEIITQLEPKPGRLYSAERPQYISPDIYVNKLGDEYVIMLDEDGLPKLKINSLYKEFLEGKKVIAPETKEFLQNKLRSAIWLIKSIHQRQRTIYKVTESIVKFQQEFLDHGISRLKPLILKDVAEDINMHESTISRVTTNKYVHTPQGMFELKFFFNSAINRFEGDSVASESVKEDIRKIIHEEDRRNPLSDKKIVEILKKKGIEIARRTVAKYRELLGILPSSRRKDPFAKASR
jgi:RNA polymerase sigma-54 factor